MYKTALTVGVFDMLHEGHVNLLRTMDETARSVYVVIHDDYSTFLNKGRFPVQTVGHREHNLSQLKIATEIVRCYDADPSGVIEKAIVAMKPLGSLVYMRGDDWEDFPGREVMETYTVPIQLIPYTEGVSSTKLRDSLFLRDSL